MTLKQLSKLLATLPKKYFHFSHLTSMTNKHPSNYMLNLDMEIREIIYCLRILVG